jgi:hypothetical protein
VYKENQKFTSLEDAIKHHKIIIKRGIQSILSASENGAIKKCQKIQQNLDAGKYDNTNNTYQNMRLRWKPSYGKAMNTGMLGVGDLGVRNPRRPRHE